jgi:hypothetical protein
MFRDKFWLSFALTIPVVFWSSDVQHWLGYRAPSFPGSNLIAPILGTVVFIYGGLVFICGAWSELADHKPGMMTLITQCMSAFRYPNKNSNMITIKITPTIPNIQKPSRTENCSTAFLLPLDGQWLCMRMVGQRFAKSKRRAVMPFRWPTARNT